MKTKKIKTLKELNAYERHLIKKEAAIKSLLTEDVKNIKSSFVRNSISSIIGQTAFAQGLDMVTPFFKNKELQGFLKNFEFFKYFKLGIKIFESVFKKDSDLKA